MPIEPGQILSHYRIDRKIGAGGMGEVWAATDTRLNRSAAIKALPADLARDPDRLARFKREAQLLASLNHPNIASIYGLEEVDHSPYLALELVEGHDLSARIEQGPIPIDEALDIAAQVAAALVEAHDKGVIHRDLKPANVKITPDGKVKVLDFGLAKALAGDPGGGASTDVTHSPTLTAAMGTQAGLIMGTAGYMSPEQARGKEVDRRADVWAFGVVLFEMLTGKRLFTGETATDIIAAVVTRRPDWSELPAATPVTVRRLLRRCLQQDPRRRIRDMGDVLIEITNPDSEAATVPPGVTAPAPPPGVSRWVAGGIGLAAGLIIALLAYVTMASPAAPPATTWANLIAPAETPFEYSGFLEISPDGRRVVFVAPGTDGTHLLWIRDLDSEQVRPLNGTTRAHMPFWSPDSRFIGYFAERKLRKISADGGVPVTLCDIGLAPRGGAWGEDGSILFVPDWSHPVFRVPDVGGKPEQITHLDPNRMELSHRWPQFLPDGRHFLYYAVSTYPELNPSNPSDVDQSGLYLGSFDGTPPRLLQTAESRAMYVEGSLLFVDGGILTARPFDLDSMSVHGQPVPIAEKVTQNVQSLWGGALFSVSREGTLMFVRGASERDALSRFVWRDRKGNEIGAFGEPAAYASFRLSHDGRQVATAIDDPADVWIFDTVRGTSRRFTFDSGNDIAPRWSPDDSRILFMSSRVMPGNRFSPANLFTRAASGSEEANHLMSLEDTATPNDWSPDGRFALLDATGAGAGTDILLYSFEDGTIIPFLKTEHGEEAARFSPDGRLIVYGSDESGRSEIYVRTFPDPGGKWQISNNGGQSPVWSRDGKEIFYLDDDNNLMSVPVENAGGFRPGTPVKLFETRVRFLRDVPYVYDVVPDGRRILLLEPIDERENADATVTLVRNWTNLLDR